MKCTCFLHLSVPRKCEKIKANKTSKISLEFEAIWTLQNFCFENVFFLQILCRSSTKRHWFIKVDLKYWSYMSVKLPETAFKFFINFHNSKLLPITHGWQSAVHILLVSIIAPIKSPLPAHIGLRNLWFDIPPNHIFKHTCPKIEFSFWPDEIF